MDSVFFWHHLYMKKIVLLFIFLVYINHSFAQTAEIAKNAPIAIKCICCGPIDPAKAPLYVVNEKVVPYGSFSIVDPMQIESLAVLRESEAGVYRERAKYGVIIIKMKKQVQWMSLSDFLSKKNIKFSDRNLPIYFNGAFLKYDFILVNNAKKLVCRVLNSLPISPASTAFQGKYLSITETND
jgi:hypothetical protein